MWILLSLLAPLLFAIVNHIDEDLVKHKSTPGALMLISGLFGFIAALVSIVFIIYGDFSIITSSTAIIALLITGALDTLWILLYLKALENDNAASVVPWFQLVPVFTAIFGSIFLHEFLTKTEIVAGLLIIGGATILSFDWTQKFRFKYREASLMIGASLLITIGSLLFKAFAIEEPSFWVAWFWTSLGMGISAALFLFYRPYQDEFKKMMNTSGKKVVVLNIINEILNGVGMLSVSYAGLIVPLAYVSTLSSLQPLFVVLIMLLLALKARDWSLFNSKILIPLLCAIILIITGSVLFAQIN